MCRNRIAADVQSSNHLDGDATHANHRMHESGGGKRKFEINVDSRRPVMRVVIRQESQMENSILEKIETWLAANRPDYHSLLNPPAQHYLFSALRSAVGITLPVGLRSFYLWHDGQNSDSFEPLLENLTFMTLTEIAATHQTHSDVAIFDQWDDDFWRSCWIPFLSNGGGDYLCVASETTGKVPIGSVLWYDHETSDRVIVHRHFDDFLNDLYDRMVNDRLDVG
ncbi:SMI1/KNR4 family protein [Aeoliella sp. ICT_H6.2]|uniref:SMI1/KNR4 family protein n=1 Tax=Aeoliella straminimaris TaxID=2954799 RepID=A0A9X2JJ61_9BACT|nr:SMI1/KNR4 family protein [Aeoliella straminimaris]MCO6046408.1 SMI1/KNR4 family protein [Aeoliella straminimaris]